MKNNCKFAIFLPNHDVCDAFWETEVHLIEKKRWKSILLKKYSFPYGELLSPKKRHKRHGWAKKWQIYSYFSFLPTMTFSFFNVIVGHFYSKIMNFFLIFNVLLKKYSFHYRRTFETQFSSQTSTMTFLNKNDQPWH